MKRQKFLTSLMLIAFSIAIVFSGCNSAAEQAAKLKQDSIKMADSLKKVAEEKEHKKHWEYEGEKGPDHWRELTEEYAACGGQVQSPIDIVGATKDKNLKPIVVDYTDLKEFKLTCNGHTLMVTVTEGDLKFNGGDYKPLQFHFHAPSEHAIAGKKFAGELHVVHKNAEGKLAVIGIMMKEGKENSVFKAIWGDVPQNTKEVVVQAPLNIEQLFPTNLSYYNYDGSLTTPPCSEGVNWIVLKTPIEVSKEQLEKLASMMPANNFRPLMPLNGRTIREL